LTYICSVSWCMFALITGCMKSILPYLFVITTIGFAAGQSGPDWHHKVATTLLEKTADGQSAPFIILLSQQADLSSARRINSKVEKGTYVFNMLREKSMETQGGLIEFLKEYNAPYQSLYIINAIRTEGTQALIQSLAERNDVSRILSNQIMRFAEPVEMPDQPNYNRENITWGINMINADDVWALGYEGQGVVVGGEDTGYEWTHPALKKQYRGYDTVRDSANHNYNWHDAIHFISPLSNDSLNGCGIDVREPCDDYGHGTHTMGTMIGLDTAEQIGVAPAAQWCGCRNMERGNGSPATYLECFQWFLAPTDLDDDNPDPSKAPHVINNSWGCSEAEGCDSSNLLVLEMAVNNLKLAGIVVVVSAGNSGSDCGTVSAPPAFYEGSFSVGATAENDTIAGFSSRGPVTVDGSNRLKPNVSAPGVRVRSARLNGNYGNSSGTSMAGPHVAGMVALIISANPDLAGKVDIIENIIEQTAVPKTTDQMCGDVPGSSIPNNTYGYGRIDALAAVNAALALIPSGNHQAEEIPGFKIYPNPVDNILIIDLSNNIGDAHIQIFDAQGRLVKTHDKNSDALSFVQVDLSQQPSGIYFYRISMEGKMEIGKVVKN